MFFDAAVVAASGALTGVSEAFGVQEMLSAVSSNGAPPRAGEGFGFNAEWLQTAPSGAGFLGPNASSANHIPATGTALSATLSSFALLDQLAVRPDSSLKAFVSANPAAIRALVLHPPGASLVASLWSTLTANRQKSLTRMAPQLVGNLEGVPIAVRDAANRRYLSECVAAITARLNTGIGRAKLLNDRHHLTVLKQVQRTLVAPHGEQPRQLLTFDPSGEVRAAVVVGDLAVADYVTYLVPGMFFTVQGQIYDWTVIAADLQHEQTRWISRLSQSDSSLAGKTAATVSWIGYSTPGVLDIASLTKANQGANFLGASLNGLKATRAGAEPFVSLIAHSYGSTAAMIELAKGGVTVDALAMVGSPGSATQKASTLDVTNDNVFVGEATLDPIVNTAFYGSDPGSAAFGARRMSVSGGVDAITHRPLSAAVGHLGYFDPGSEAMRNFALIGLNEGTLVTNGTISDASRVPGSRAY